MCSCRPSVRPIYSVADLSELSGLSRFQVGRLLRSNEVPTTRSGRKVFVTLSALRAALPWVFDAMREAETLSVVEAR